MIRTVKNFLTASIFAVLAAGATLTAQAQTVTTTGQIADLRTPNAAFRQYATSFQPGDMIKVRWKASAGCHLTLALYDRYTGAPITDGRGPIVLVGNPTSPFSWNTMTLPIPVFARDAVLSVRNPDRQTGVVTYFLYTPNTVAVHPVTAPVIADRKFVIDSSKGTIYGQVKLTNTSNFRAASTVFDVADRTNFQTIGLIPIVTYKVGTIMPNGEWVGYPTMSTRVRSITATISTTNYGNTYSYASSFPVQ